MDAKAILWIYDDCLNSNIFVSSYTWSIISPSVKLKTKRPGFYRYKLKASLNVIPDQVGAKDETFMYVVADTIADDIEGTKQAKKGLIKINARQIDMKIYNDQLFIKYEIEYEC